MQMSEWINKYFLTGIQEHNSKLPLILNFHAKSWWSFSNNWNGFLENAFWLLTSVRRELSRHPGFQTALCIVHQDIRYSAHIDWVYLEAEIPKIIEDSYAMREHRVWFALSNSTMTEQHTSMTWRYKPLPKGYNKCTHDWDKTECRCYWKYTKAMGEFRKKIMNVLGT